jgi:hypothetical protein
MKKEIAESYEKIFKLESLILEQAAQGQITCGLEMQMRIETSNYLRLTHSILRYDIRTKA